MTEFRPARTQRNKVSPAVPGNTAALVHGAFSRRTVEPVARAIAAELLAAAPYLNDARYTGAVESLAVAEARLRLLDRWLGEKGLLTRKGRPWAAADYALRLERLAADLRRALGLTPAAAAAIGQAVAATEVDLARLWSGTAPDVAAHQPVAAEDATANGDPVPEPPGKVPGGVAGADGDQ